MSNPNPLIPEATAYPNQSGCPRVALACDISAAYLRENACDPSSIVGAVKLAIAAEVSAHAAEPLRIAELTTAAASVGGATNVRNLTINGLPVDFEGFAGSARMLPNLVDLTVGSIA